MSQFLSGQHQYTIYATIVRLGSGRSTLALGTIGAPVHVTRIDVARRSMSLCSWF